MAQTNRMGRDKLLNISLFVVSLIPMLLFVFVFSQRVNYPFDIEWAEGAGVNQVRQIINGDPLYGPPSLDFTALVYTPGYYYLAALAAMLTGSILPALRFVSIVSSLGACGLIFWIVFRRTKHFLASWLAAGLYLACFSISEGYYDLARVDSLYVFTLLIGLVVIISARDLAGYAITGLCIAAAFFVKQAAVLAFIPLMVYCLVNKLHKTWPMLAAGGLGVIIPWMVIDNHTEGWFSYYVFYLPAQHGYSLLTAVDFWVGDILSPLGIVIAFLAGYFFWKPWRNSPQERDGISLDASSHLKSILGKGKPEALLIMFGLGAVLTAWLTRASNGGGANNSMSAFASIAILFGLAVKHGLQDIEDAGAVRVSRSGLLATVVAIQFLGLIYNPFRFVPSALDKTLNQDLIDVIQTVEGPVLIPYRSHLLAQADKEASVHMINLFELTGYFKGEVQPEGNRLVDQLRSRVCYQEYDLVILDQPVGWLDPYLQAAYQKQENPHSGVEGYRSEAQKWQRGQDFTYIPRDVYQAQACLDLLSED